MAVDVETANKDIGSTCQIGLAAFKDGAIVQEWSSLINPEEAFSGFNIRDGCGRGRCPDFAGGSKNFAVLAGPARGGLSHPIRPEGTGSRLRQIWASRTQVSLVGFLSSGPASLEIIGKP